MDINKVKKNLLLHKIIGKYDRIMFPEKSDVYLKRNYNFLKDGYKHIKKSFFKGLKFDFEERFKLGDDFLEIFKNPYLLNFIKEEDEFYVFEKAQGFVYDKLMPSMEQNTIIYLNHQICKYFQEQFNTDLFLFGETNKIDDLVFTEEKIILHDIKKLVLFKENILEDLFCKK